jgi:hypothetical protein
MNRQAPHDPIRDSAFYDYSRFDENALDSEEVLYARMDDADDSEDDDIDYGELLDEMEDQESWIDSMTTADED